MTLSIELLPAPLGPMMARISCSRTLNEMSVSALTPPNDNEMFCMSSMTSPMSCARVWLLMVYAALAVMAGKVRAARDLQVGRDAAHAAVLELHLGFDELRILAAVQRIDQHAVLLADEGAPHLAGAGQFVVVGVQLLVQDQEAADLRSRQARVARQVGVDLPRSPAARRRPRPCRPGRYSPRTAARGVRPSCPPPRGRC